MEFFDWSGEAGGGHVFSFLVFSGLVLGLKGSAHGLAIGLTCTRVLNKKKKKKVIFLDRCQSTAAAAAATVIATHIILNRRVCIIDVKKLNKTVINRKVCKISCYFRVRFMWLINHGHNINRKVCKTLLLDMLRVISVVLNTQVAPKIYLFSSLVSRTITLQQLCFYLLSYR